MIDVRLELKGSKTISEEELFQIKFEMHIMGEFYSRVLGKIKGVTKVIIELTDQSDTNLPFVVPYSKNNDIPVVKDMIDIKKFIMLTSEERREFLCDMIFEMIKSISTQIGLDEKILHTGSRLIKDLNYENNYFLTKVKTSPDRKLKAGIRVKMRYIGADISVVFFDRHNLELKEVSVINLWPNSYFISALISNGSWKDNDQFEIRNKSKEIIFTVSYSKGTCTIDFVPKHTDSKLLKDILDYSTFKERSEVKHLYGDILKNI